MKQRLLWVTLISLIIALITTLKITTQNENNAESKYTAQTVLPGNESEYDIGLTMTENGKFNIKTTILISNASKDDWHDMVFYFIPNIFTKATSKEIQNTLRTPAVVKLHQITLNGAETDYHLDKDTLRIPLLEKLKPGESAEVYFDYEFTLPEGGRRFTKMNRNYHLAQFYPMVATYRDHKWNKADYGFRGETYHTGFSKFRVSYAIPEGYTFVSTGDDEPYLDNSVGTFKVDNVKEIFIGILKEPFVTEKQEGEIKIRVFGFDDNMDLYKDISEAASDSIRYFQKIMGPYPFTKLDIIVEGSGMEYPGIITIGGAMHGENSINNSLEDLLKSMVVHEIAHQWFYGIISNDPFHDAWLDEGFATFAEGLFHISKTDTEIPYQSMYDRLDKIEPLPVNLPLDQYEDGTYIYERSSTMLWLLFENRGGVDAAEEFLRTYYDFYKFKEINTEEFVRFTQYYFNLEETSEFENWLE